MILSDPVVLEEPVRRGETEIAEVSIRKPHASSLYGVKMLDLMQLDIEALHTVLPRVIEPLLSPAEVRNLDPADLVDLGGKLAAFFIKKPKGAETAVQQA